MCIRDRFINTVSAVVLDVLNITDSMLEEKEDSIVEHITSSLEKTSQDIDHFSSAVDLLIETAQSAQELTTAAQALLPDTDTTIQDMSLIHILSSPPIRMSLQRQQTISKDFPLTVSR